MVVSFRTHSLTGILNFLAKQLKDRPVFLNNSNGKIRSSLSTEPYRYIKFSQNWPIKNVSQCYSRRPIKKTGGGAFQVIDNKRIKCYQLYYTFNSTYQIISSVRIENFSFLAFMYFCGFFFLFI